MDNILYLECFSGISGDMTVAALLDLGADKEVLLEGLKSLNVDGYKIEISRVKKCGIDSCDFNVILENEEYNHSHHHHHEHRNILDIYKIIENSNITNNAKKISKNIFNKVAEAEAIAHGVDISNVHFHEVGAIDSIVDIVAAAICIDNLNITKFIVSELHEGQGHVHCQHGIIPVPVPAVLNIIANNNLSIKFTKNRGEMITPTGAAIAAALKDDNLELNNFKIKKIGMGAGKKDFEKANILRVMLLEKDKKVNDDIIYKLETNIDDSTGEALSYVMDKLFEVGAKDVYYTPIYMKKNRPAFMLNVLCDEAKIYDIEKIIFNHLTTIGIRKLKLERDILKRHIFTFNSSFGKCDVKVCEFESNRFYYPEFESIKKICDETGKSFDYIYNRIKMEVENNI